MTNFSFKQLLANPALAASFDPTLDRLDLMVPASLARVQAVADGVKFTTAAGSVVLPMDIRQVVCTGGPGGNIAVSAGQLAVGDNHLAVVNDNLANHFTAATDRGTQYHGLGGGDVFIGGDGHDLVFGGPGVDRLVGAGGNDTLDGGTGRSVILGGAGNDLIIGGDGSDVLRGGGGGDRIQGGAGADTLDGDAGNDFLSGGAGSDRITAATGNDVVNGGDGPDLLVAGIGHDRVAGGPGRDYLHGGPGDDVLSGNPGVDKILGGAGDDILLGGMGPDLLLGGSGDDLLRGNADNDILRDGGGNDTLYGGDGADNIQASAGVDWLYGDAGADILMGGAQGDWLLGGSADDQLFGQDGADTLFGNLGNDVLIGGAGADHHMFTPGNGDDIDVVVGFGALDSLELRRCFVAPRDIVQQGGDVRVTLSSGDQILFKNTAWADVSTAFQPYLMLTGIKATALTYQGGNFLVNTSTSGWQANPSIAPLADGGFIVFWDSGKADHPLGQRYDAHGVPVGGEFNATGHDQYPGSSATQAELADGGLVRTWVKYGGFTDGLDVRVQRFNVDDDPVSRVLLVNRDHVWGDQDQPAITALTHGGFVVAWRDNGLEEPVDAGGRYGTLDGSDGGIVAQLFGPGSPVIHEDDTIFLEISAPSPAVAGRFWSAVVGGLPNGAMLTAGTALGDGRWRLSAADLENLRLIPARHAGSDLTLTVTARDVNFTTNAVTTRSLTVTVHDVVDNPVVSDATMDLVRLGEVLAGHDPGPVPLEISAWLADQDGSERLIVVVDDMPAGSTLSAGTPMDNGSWRLTAADLNGLTVNPVGDEYGIFRVSVYALAREAETGDVARSRETITIESTDLGVTVTGGEGADSLFGGAIRDVLLGAGGDDVLIGKGGNDLLGGGGDNDSLEGGDGNDALTGGSGDDTLWGGFGDDRLIGSPGHDHLVGEVGADTLEGGDGDDLLNGGVGDDLIIGGAGADSLRGAAGLDTLIGGPGEDWHYGMFNDPELHVFTAPEDGLDRLSGFRWNEDRIIIYSSGFADITAVDASNFVNMNAGGVVGPDTRFYMDGALFHDPDGSGTDSDPVMLAAFPDSRAELYLDHSHIDVWMV